ncbi:polyprotein [Phytophthora megakarya]|uniref:Polyprotein n=1 Tax=Phytophthora megakarya TaxID=4795 RepID=A0A225WA47_9STRA|nr:polyprotein [Phytophthora megakarya]
MNGNGAKKESVEVVAYSDADFAADKEDRKSLTGGYTAASVLATEVLGIRELLNELDVKLEIPMPLLVDNQAALKQLDGESSSRKAKHVDVRIKFVGSYTRK